mgnify:CR=1 FL=1
MKPKSYSILLDIYKGVLNNNQLIEFTTGDNGQSVLEFVLLEDKITAYNLDGCMVRMVIEGQQQDCTIVDASNGKVKIVLLQSMFSRPGNVMAEIQIYDSSDQTLRLTTPRFQYNVRKSLMNNTTVQADPNYSILQNMILEVSSADEVAKQAKKTAESAMTTANQAESKANQIMDNGNYAKEQGDYAKAEGDRLQGMLTIDGTAQTKFDFIKNQVVKDGLIDSVPYTKLNGSALSKVLTINGDFTLIASYGIDDTTNYIITIDSYRLLVHYNAHTSSYRVGYKLTPSGAIQYMDTRISSDVKQLNIAIRQIGSRIVLSINSWSTSLAMTLENKSTVIRYSSVQDGNITTGILYGALFYEKVLSENEIQRTFSVLNSSQSIKELRTTDATGKTSILNLASSEDFVEMSTGRTLREEYMGVLKTMGEDFTSSDGSPIQVPKGIEARVINAEIKGQTVKCISKLLKYTHDASTGRTKDVNLQLEKAKYTFSVEVTENVGNNILGFIFKDGASDVYKNIPINGVGFFKNVIDLSTCINNPRLYAIYATESGVSGSNKLVEQVNILYGEVNLITGLVDKGLSSTQAIVSNNGQQYPIYANEEDKANKKVISLGGLGDTKDTLEILEDGSGIWLNRLARVVLNGSENWSIGNTGTQNYYYQCTLPFGTQSGGVSDKYSFAAIGQSDINQGFYITGNSLVRVRYGTEKPLNDFKQDLSTNNLTIICILATPIITHIPKEIVSAILTHNQTNILEAGGAVKPSSFKVTVPVDKLAEIEARLQALESTTVDVVLNK